MKKIFVIKEKCNGCMSCVVACTLAHEKASTYQSASKIEPGRISVQAVKGKPVPLVCHHCENPACVNACMSGAMQKDSETGIVSNEGNLQKCVGCWMCIMACPYGVITPKKDGSQKVAVKCDLCKNRAAGPACAEACPTGAIVLMEEEEFADYKRKITAYEIKD
ncbi:iron-sulfur protein [Oxobacter pfennigii]|uniref:Iron-sulfur protein n=1 Tax=Oxobacter pfennigii TaxID=36849 RepID=A0A0P8WTU4_9CLOT|nr:4Fe-4S dicluster domain-containing protein [Oxobacter pfennigii]KPU46087.1 iron-sulfur protein [Oxobacter pfennigii]